MIDFDMSLRDDSTRLSKSFPGHVCVIRDFLMMNDEAYRKMELIVHKTGNKNLIA